MENELMCYLQELLAEAVERAETGMTRAFQQDLPEDTAVKCCKQFSRASKMQLAFEDFIEEAAIGGGGDG